MDNIFEGAKFGDKFLTRDGRIAILIHLGTYATLSILIQEEHGFTSIQEEYYLDGYRIYQLDESWDIVSRYKEPIDEKKLEELAYAHIGQIMPKNVNEKMDLWISLNDILRKEYISFKSGYRKAKEE